MATRIDRTRRHAKKRAAQRLGIRLSKKVELQIIGIIRSHKSVVIGTTSRTRTVHEIVLNGRTFRVVYSNSTKQLVTVFDERK